MTTNIEVKLRRPEVHHQKDRFSIFFEQHSTTRKLVAYLPPIYFGVGAVVKQMTSYDILPGLSPASALVCIPIWFFSFAAKDCERSMQNKKIERINSFVDKLLSPFV